MKRFSFWREENGAAMAEFALVLLPFAAMIFAIIYGALIFYANQTLQFATEAAARCYSVDASTCGTIGNVQTYAASRYTGPNIGATFTPTATGCGHTVTGTGNFPINIVVWSTSIAMNSSACFP
jgi:Flp pilus assembly protein TadG